MAVESTTSIGGLITTSPSDTGEPRREGAAHLRLLKTVLKTTFPNVTGPITPTHTVLNGLPAKVAAAELDIAGVLNGSKSFTGNIVISRTNGEIRLRRSTSNFAFLQQASGGNVLYLTSYFPDGANNIDLDPVPTDLASSSRVRLFRNVSTTGWVGINFHKANASPSGIASSFYLNSARDGLNISGKINFIEHAPTSQFPATVSTHLVRKVEADAIEEAIRDGDWKSEGNSLQSRTHTHDLGVSPRRVQVSITCIEADLGHAIGDTIHNFNFQTQGDSDGGFMLISNTTQIKIIMKSLRFLQANEAGPSPLTVARWTYTVRAWR